MRMVGTGKAPHGYMKDQIFDVAEEDEGTVEDLERRGWAKRVDPKDDPGREKVSVANAMVRNDLILDPYDREVAREIGTHAEALAIVHLQDPDATPADYDEEVRAARGRDPLGRPLAEPELRVLEEDAERARKAAGGPDAEGKKKKND